MERKLERAWGLRCTVRPHEPRIGVRGKQLYAPGPPWPPAMIHLTWPGPRGAQAVGYLTDVRLTLSMGPGGAWGVEGGEREGSWCWQGAPRAENHREPHRITARGRPEPREARSGLKGPADPAPSWAPSWSPCCPAFRGRSPSSLHRPWGLRGASGPGGERGGGGADRGVGGLGQ